MKIKSIILFAVALCALSACGPSKEEKAEEMAANYLKGVLYHYDSYESLKTTVDSSFVSLSTDKDAIDLTIDMMKLFGLIQKYSDNIEMAESSMEIWSSGGCYSAYERGEYRRAQEDRDKNQQLLDKTRDRIQDQFSKIKNRQANLKDGAFDGWKVYHKFKSLNGAATIDLFGEYIFICDEEFNEKLAYTKEDYDALSKVMSIISTSEDLSEFAENVQGLIF